MILSMMQRSSKQRWSEAIQQLQVEHIICHLPESTILVTLDKIAAGNRCSIDGCIIAWLFDIVTVDAHFAYC